MKTLGSNLPSTLKQRANWLNELNRHLQSVLPVEFHGHVQVVSLQHNHLTLEADSPNWASKIRYQSNEIANLMSIGTGLTIKTVHTSIRPATAKNLSEKRLPLAISPQSAQQFSALAKSIEHPGLKQALAKLAQRGKRQT